MTGFIGLLLVSLAAAASPLPDGAWRIDPQRSTVRFTVTKLQTKVVEGRFRDFAGDVFLDSRDPQRSSMQWRVRVDSIDTGEPDRDSAVRSADYLDARRFPELTFVSRQIQPLPDGRIRLVGTITLRGRQRPLTITARALGNDPSRPSFETRFDLDRMDFGVDGGSITRHAISRKVSVHLIAVGERR